MKVQILLKYFIDLHLSILIEFVMHTVIYLYRRPRMFSTSPSCPSIFLLLFSSFFNQPNGKIVRLMHNPNISLSHVWNEYKRDPFRLRNLGWTEKMLVNGRGSLIDTKTYWVKSSEICGEFIGR